jgi:hypothetical protein
MVKTKRLYVVLFLVFSQPAFTQIGPAAGFDASPFLSYGSNTYGWEVMAAYPFVGVRAQAGDDWIFCLSGFGGGGVSLAIAGGSDPTSGTIKSGDSWEAKGYKTGLLFSLTWPKPKPKIKIPLPSHPGTDSRMCLAPDYIRGANIRSTSGTTR